MTRTKNIFLGIWLTAALLLAGPALGQETGTVESVQLAAIDAAPVPEMVQLSLNKARVYKLPRKMFFVRVIAFTRRKAISCMACWVSRPCAAR